MALKDCKFKGTYKIKDFKSSANAIDNFLIPGLSNSKMYKRCAAYFRSSFFRLCHVGMKNFFKSGGQIKLLCNHHLMDKDKNSMVDGLINDLSTDIDDLLDDYKTKDRFRLLATLICSKKIEIRICIPKNPKDELSIFHDKTGIFKDDTDTIVFGGGINESYMGWRKNNDRIVILSSIEDDRDDDIKDIEADFDEHWKLGDTGDWTTMELPTAIIEKRIKVNSYNDDEWEVAFDEQEAIEHEIKKNLNEHNPLKESEEKKIINHVKNEKTYKRELGQINLREYQQRAINCWEQNKYKAIIKYCTGSGKTMIAMEAINKMLNLGKTPIIIVPSIPLIYQWEENLKKYVDAKILSCHSKSKIDYKKYLSSFSSKNDEKAIILATVHTAVKPKFKNSIKCGEHNFLVVDECHSLWTQRYNAILGLDWGDCPRLAISATPEDTSFTESIGEDGIEDLELYEEEADNRNIGKVNIFEFFGGKRSETGGYIANAEYNISDAIRDKWLMTYEYNIATAFLNEDETEEFIKLSNLIKRFSHTRRTREEKEKLTSLCNMRARIIKIAEDKRNVCNRILGSEREKNHKTLEDDHWLIYVGPGVTDEESEIHHVRRSINNDFKNVNVYPYHSDIDNRESLLENFINTGGICLACDMLDEGVDIPVLSKAIVMASSSNERQFIQRRGRVLRIDDRVRMAKHAHVKIWDIFTLPATHENLGFYREHMLNEYKRAEIFANDALNRDIVLSQISRLRDRYE